MQRALELAARGAGSVSPNPMVGAVLVVANEIIGQGWHERYGEAHAEVNAIASVSEPSLLEDATMYVTLEPCSHWGKTPPCCDLIIRCKIPRVVVGCVDPYHEVCGGGIERMRAAGIEVIVGDMEQQCIDMNRRFFKAQTDGRPYIILKWAETADSFIDVCRPATTPPAWMTGAHCKRLVHMWRSEEDAIMVGRHTVEMDNPSLTVRQVEGRNPLRITLDKELKLDTHYRIFDNEAPTILITSHEMKDRAIAKFSQNERVEIESIDYAENTIAQILNILSCRRVHSLFVEGGRELLQSFLDSMLWDEARVFTSPLRCAELYPAIANPVGVPAPSFSPTSESRTMVGEVELTICKRPIA